MPSDIMVEFLPGKVVDSARLATLIEKTDFSERGATVVGYGNVGKQYVRALRALGVGRIRVCSRSPGPLAELEDSDTETISGGFEQLKCTAHEEDLGIVAVPPSLLVAAARRLVDLGFKRLLIEKPVSLWPDEIDNLAALFKSHGIVATCAYNRLAYPSFHEVRARVHEEGGATSCTYTFTEMIKPDWFERFPAAELARWGIANSSHVISMAHGLIGMPADWNCHISGSLPWHSSGSVFVGSGLSALSIPFSYHADWGSTGRWSVEVHTSASSYSLCPMEKAYRRTAALSGWEPVPIKTFAPEIKVGFVEQLAYNLGLGDQSPRMSMSLVEAAALARYAEQIFGYKKKGAS